MLEKNPRGIGKTREKFSPIMKILPSMFNSPQAPWVLYPGEAQCEAKSIFTKSRALGRHALTLGNISPLLFSLHLKNPAVSGIAMRNSHQTKITLRTWYKATFKARKYPMELEAWDTVIQPIQLLEEQGLRIKGTCNSWKNSIKGSRAPHWFVKWWHCWVTCDLCLLEAEPCAQWIVCTVTSPGNLWSWAGKGGHSQAQTFNQRCFYSIKYNSKDTKCDDSEPTH